MKTICKLTIVALLFPCMGYTCVRVGLERIFQERQYLEKIRGKRIALISHSAAINRQGEHSLSVFDKHKEVCKLSALCTLEHGYFGASIAETPGYDPVLADIPVVSLFASKEIPSEVIEACDVFVYDVQDIGVRSYSFISALLQVVKASESSQKELIVLDRPNPMGGNMVDGPLPDKGVLPAIPYCYGMTPGELALLYRAWYAPNAQITVVPMQGWKRSMTFADTGLIWVPTSPQVPDSQSAYFYAATGVIGALSITNIGIGYTLPFKVIGAPWMDGCKVAQELNKARLPGVQFLPFMYEPFFGKFKMEICSGVLLVLQDPKVFLPMETQSVILGVLKTLYPKEVEQAFLLLDRLAPRRKAILSLLGCAEFLDVCLQKKYITWPLRTLCVEGRKSFKEARQAFLLAENAQ
ncbi:DUF1343 domain-containing protein [Chlamydia suis]|uniref:DUF1343 domain-containing protein n=1 Tax=Chlamydia suis TaxID=83559 RepID=UPI0009B0B4A1|nr:exo-beta-N-acetylmuramidase NamZ domain-containing protein [Chlamydia suis]